eukprot:scaffold542_cov202-Alexandrium_tamarense.AAC.21
MLQFAWGRVDCPGKWGRLPLRERRAWCLDCWNLMIDLARRLAVRHRRNHPEQWVTLWMPPRRGCHELPFSCRSPRQSSQWHPPPLDVQSDGAEVTPLHRCQRRWLTVPPLSLFG